MVASGPLSYVQHHIIINKNVLSVSLNKTFLSFHVINFKRASFDLTTGPNGTVAKSSADGLVDTGFTSRYRLQNRPGFKGPMGRCKATAPSSLSLISNRKRVTTNY